MTTQHTPLPWANDGDWIYSEADCSKVADIVGDGSPEQDHANAALIVRAVNSHEAQKEALAALLNIMDVIGYHNDPMAVQGRAALKLAMGE